MEARVSVRAFARMLGVDPRAVRKGIASGRLRRSIGYRYTCPNCGHRWEVVGRGPAYREPCARCVAADDFLRTLGDPLPEIGAAFASWAKARGLSKAEAREVESA